MAGEPTEAEVQAHASAMERLRPLGIAWTSRPDAVARKLYEALATEYARLTGRGRDIIDESDPRTTVELLTDWERLLDLPNPCGELEPTLLLRQFAVTTKLTAAGGQSQDHFKAIAEGLGFTIEIEEYVPFKAGGSQAAGFPKVGGRAGDPLTNGDWIFTWTVRGPEHGGQFATVGSFQAGDALFEENLVTLECFLAAAKPAHTSLLFDHTGTWVGWAPWTTIYPDPAVLELKAPGAIDVLIP